MITYQHLLSSIDSPAPTGACFIALADGQVVATLGLRLREPGAYVNSLYVAPNFQGQGIGRELLRQAAELSVKVGKTTLGLAVHEQNLPARRLYKSLGFRAHEFGQQDGYLRYVAFLPLPQ
jgi:ribosomal protein S18 acetylase RimI-like enzyme